MRIQKVAGSSISQFIEIGDTVFMYAETYEQPRKASLVPRQKYQGNAPRFLEPLAFKVEGHNWVISENPPSPNHPRDMPKGIALNSISADKKLRLKRDDFMQEYSQAYKDALIQEASL